MNLTQIEPDISWTSRMYQSELDLIKMQAMLVEGRRCTNDWYYPHVGDLVFWFFMVYIHLDPGEFIRLWHDHSGKLVGYAILCEDPTFDCQVLPEYEWNGIEEDALGWAESRLVELRKSDAGRWGGRLVTGSRQDNLMRIAFLEKHGFHQGGEFSEVNLLRELDEEIPAVNEPDGCQVRAFAGVAELTNRAGRYGLHGRWGR